MNEQPFGEHFSELRLRVIYCIIFFISASIVSYIYSEYIITLLTLSLGKIISTTLPEVFIANIDIAIFCGTLLSIPFFSLQIYLFISPGLLANEKKVASICLFFAPILFYIGVSFVYIYVMPAAFSFFFYINGIHQIELYAKISDYISFCKTLMIAFGLAFEVPIIIILLNKLGILSIEIIQKGRRIAIVLIFVFAGIVTPPDVLSQIALAVPMILLYEVSIIICRKLKN